MPVWEYKVENVSIADRWSAKGQTQEIINLQNRINVLGTEGWEMISYESVPMFGAFSSKLKGYAYLLFFKRLKSEAAA
jgi:hypothetical protein